MNDLAHRARVLAAAPWLYASVLLAAAYIGAREIGAFVAGVPS